MDARSTWVRPSATEAAGVPVRMRFQDLRHTYASLRLAAGFKPYELSRWMGHGSVAVTVGIYSYLYPADHAQRMDRFESLVSQG